MQRVDLARLDGSLVGQPFGLSSRHGLELQPGGQAIRFVPLEFARAATATTLPIQPTSARTALKLPVLRRYATLARARRAPEQVHAVQVTICLELLLGRLVPPVSFLNSSFGFRLWFVYGGRFLGGVGRLSRLRVGLLIERLLPMSDRLLYGGLAFLANFSGTLNIWFFRWIFCYLLKSHYLLILFAI